MPKAEAILADAKGRLEQLTVPNSNAQRGHLQGDVHAVNKAAKTAILNAFQAPDVPPAPATTTSVPAAPGPAVAAPAGPSSAAPTPEPVPAGLPPVGARPAGPTPAAPAPEEPASAAPDQKT